MNALKGHFSFPLFQYQLDAVQKITDTLLYECYPMLNSVKIEDNLLKCFLLHDEMGLGKTVQAWATLLTLYLDKLLVHDRPILIVCPSSCLHVWLKDKPALFNVTLQQHFDSTKVYTSSDVLLVSYSFIRINYKVFESKHYCIMVLDEVQKIKNANSSTTKAISAMNREYSLCLSGTPIMNGGYEMLSILKHGLNLKRLKYGEIKQYPTGNYCLNLLSKICLGRLKRDIPELQDKVAGKDEENVFIELDDYWTRQEYILTKQSIIQDYGNKMGSTASILGSIQKLRQLCLGYPYKRTEMVDVYTFIWCVKQRYPIVYDNNRALIMLMVQILLEIRPSKKMLRVRDYVLFNEDRSMIFDDGPGPKKTIVFCSFKTFLKDVMLPFLNTGCGIKTALLCGGNKVKQQSVIKDFKTNPSTRVLLIVKSAGALGLNLHECASQIIVMDPHYNAALDEQAINRIFRISSSTQKGSTKLVKRLFVKGSIEEAMLEMQAEKELEVDSWLKTEKRGQKNTLNQYHLFLKDRDKIK